MERVLKTGDSLGHSNLLSKTGVGYGMVSSICLAIKIGTDLALFVSQIPPIRHSVHGNDGETLSGMKPRYDGRPLLRKSAKTPAFSGLTAGPVSRDSRALTISL